MALRGHTLEAGEKYLIQQTATPSSQRLGRDGMATGHLCFEGRLFIFRGWEEQQQNTKSYYLHV